MTRKLRYTLLTAVLGLLLFTPRVVSTQVAQMMFGSFNGVATAVTVTSTGLLNVSMAGGAASNLTFASFATNPATTGTIRLPHGATISGRNQANTVDIPFINWGSTANNEVVLGNAGVVVRGRSILTVPTSLADGDWWIDCTSGVTTTTGGTCSLKARTGGATRTIVTSAVF